MKKDRGFIASFLIIVVILLVVALPKIGELSRAVEYSSKNKVNELSSDTWITKSVFVGGAVLREGYFLVDSNTTYRELFLITGLFDNSSISQYDFDMRVDLSLNKIIINYYARELYFDCLNINNATLKDLEGLFIPPKIVDKLMYYLLFEGEFDDKYQIYRQGVLTKEEFEYVEYMLYCYRSD